MRTENAKARCPSLDDAVRYINAMDFLEIQKKLCSDDGLLCRKWTATEAEIAIQYYKNFLYLNKKYLDEFPVLPPMLEVDEVWHHHILDTRRYIKDCDQIFGHYFHHYPYFGTRGEKDLRNLDVAFEVLQSLYEKEFGGRMLPVWEDAQ